MKRTPPGETLRGAEDEQSEPWPQAQRQIAGDDAGDGRSKSNAASFRNPPGGFHSACLDVKPEARFVVCPGTERFAISKGLDAITLVDLVAELQGMAQ